MTLCHMDKSTLGFLELFVLVRDRRQTDEWNCGTRNGTMYREGLQQQVRYLISIHFRTTCDSDLYAQYV